MSMITPVGKKNFEWAPQEENEKVKTSSQAQYDALVEAGIVPGVDEEAFEDKQGKEDGIGCGVAQDELAVVEVDICEPCEEPCEEGGGLGLGVEEVAEEGGSGDVQEAVAELVEKAEQAEEVAEAVTDALERVEEAVQDVKSAVGVADEVTDVVEVDLEETDDDGDDDGDDVIDTTPEDELVVESEDDDKEDSDNEKTASAEDDFVKFAKISPKNRKKLRNYWISALGYPSEYVNLMTKDYEK